MGHRQLIDETKRWLKLDTNILDWFRFQEYFLVIFVVYFYYFAIFLCVFLRKLFALRRLLLLVPNTHIYLHIRTHHLYVYAFRFYLAFITIFFSSSWFFRSVAWSFIFFYEPKTILSSFSLTHKTDYSYAQFFFWKKRQKDLRMTYKYTNMTSPITTKKAQIHPKHATITHTHIHRWIFRMEWTVCCETMYFVCVFMRTS